MVDGIERTIISGTIGARVGTSTAEHEFFRVRRRENQERRSNRDNADPETQTRPQARPQMRTGPAGGVAAYGQTARSGRAEDAHVVLSRSAAILVDGNLESVMRRATEAIHMLAASLLGVPNARSDDLMEVFRKEAFEWVRQALARYTAYSERHDHLPFGLTFDDVRLSIDQDLDVLDIEVGGVHFRDRFEFRTEGVVFDVRGTAAVHRPRPGFFVDTGVHGAEIADDIIAKVRTDLHEFGADARTGGVAVMIRSDSSAYSRVDRAAVTVDMDILVPFDADWQGEA
jgi:hypothetical protein